MKNHKFIYIIIIIIIILLFSFPPFIKFFPFWGKENIILFLDNPPPKGNIGNPPPRSPRDFYEWCVYLGISGLALLLLWRLFIKGDWGKIADFIRDFFGGGGGLGGSGGDIGGGTPAA